MHRHICDGTFGPARGLWRSVAAPSQSPRHVCKPPWPARSRQRLASCTSLQQQHKQTEFVPEGCKGTERSSKPLSSKVLIPAGLMGLASVLCWSQHAAAADLQQNVHHVGSSIHKGLHLPTELFQLSSEEDFWGNVYAYIRYFFSVLLGTAYIAIKPIAGLFKRPVTAVLTVAGLVLLFVFVSTTVNAMLGMSDLTPFEPLNTMTNLES